MILVVIEHADKTVKKVSLEALTLAKDIAGKLGTGVAALSIGAIDGAGQLGKYGADTCFVVEHENLSSFDSTNYTSAITQVAKAKDASIVILSHTSTGKSLAGRLAVQTDAGVLTGVNQFAGLEGEQLVLKKPVFAGKGIATYQLRATKAVFTLMGNAVQPKELGSECPVESFAVEVATPQTKVLKIDRVKGKVPLPEAEIVVSAGRGMKGPENWGIIEELADELGATTACSRPVADMDWRPHNEHVGQTGIAISPNLYIAAGISGAIQHLAGVNSSKNIVVINKDPEAPFFKAADYGVVGDLFEVVPRLTEAIRKYKSSH